ncbi:hypothetical protein N9201_00665 [bacterium]|nr:hypothetical protein [bacterium]MDB4410183.1 hypothetical protein [bacterium]MDB4425089.1 hypothetical protein [Akkermansiaceae bacterium]
MKIKTLFPLLALLVPVLKAETLVVLSGNSIQEKIDAASDGDIIAIFGGTYNQNITVNKKIRLVELAGQDVYITGSVTFTDLEETPPFQGFRVAGINIRGTKGLVIKDVDCDGGLTLWGNGVPDVSVVGGSQGSITQRAGSLVTNSTTTTGSFTAESGAVKTIAFRTTVKGIFICGGDDAKTWFGYGEVAAFRLGGSNSKLVLVGSKLARSSPGVLLTITGSNHRVTISNSSFDSPQWNISAEGGNHNINILNNLFKKTSGTSDIPCIIVHNVDVLKVSGNIFNSAYGGLIQAGFGGDFFGNHSYGDGRMKGSIVASTPLTTGDPLFVDGDYYNLGEGSPCINKGPADPRFNDLDGSRNDIGPSGGSWYDPEGWTTENPVVISFDLSPDQVLGGVNDEVEISEIQAISAP